MLTEHRYSLVDFAGLDESLSITLLNYYAIRSQWSSTLQDFEYRLHMPDSIVTRHV